VTSTRQLRGALTGLLSFAAAEEQMLLATAARDGQGAGGGPDRWAAVPLVAHDNHFKTQQAERIRAIQSGQVPTASGEIDHASATVYRGYSARRPDDVLAECRRVTAELIDGTWALADEDLLDPARHPWLNGRLLWLQIIVRGFWHPTGHIADYYLGHGQQDLAVALQAHAVATAAYLGAPDPATGMAYYGLACAQAVAGLADLAAVTLTTAIELNPDLRANADRDPDFAALR
jgi:acyl-CoA synthetase (AMP-forming)/AMP-acid ligase II